MLTRVKHALVAAVRDENLDLYLLAAAALVFTILGATNVSSPAALSSMILATLAVLALSQIRSRRSSSELAEARRVAPSTMFQERFPEDLEARRSSARDLLYVGISMYRTLPGLRNDLRRMVEQGIRIRVLLVDPADEALLREAVMRVRGVVDHQHLAGRITASLGELRSLRLDAVRGVEIRVASSVPAVGLNIIDDGTPDGTLVMQHYVYRGGDGPTPIVRLSVDDGYWYQHFVREAERMWADGSPWPPDPDARLARLPRPSFVEEFGDELFGRLGGAGDLFVTGVTRNTLLYSHYDQFERCLLAGGRIRFLLVDPDSVAVSVAAERYYAVRSPEHPRQRIVHSLRMLDQLKTTTGGDIEVRLTTYAMSVGAVAVDATGARPAGPPALYLEYFTYQAGGEPKFVLEPRDGRAYQQFLREAEILWAAGRRYPLGRPGDDGTGRDETAGDETAGDAAGGTVADGTATGGAAAGT
jgi:hypothetical protein